jgi:hypothetical protein
MVIYSSAKAKGQKMALGRFYECVLRFTQPILETLQRLTSYSFGLWADEMEDMPMLCKFTAILAQWVDG